ncbi:hypothetical protein [Halobaculum limi]|uniref:hypothetical protein n=1 Tax=Halobaculum limi TaxID=3031916 RepID=UPI0024066679|nr:hypothetical protein [Halobaculum sp. YSMS11]
MKDTSHLPVVRAVSTWLITLRRPLVAVAALAIVAVAPVHAQTTGTAFCDTDMVATIKNVFTLIQFGGPLIGGVIALGSTVALPAVSRADRKKEVTEMRNQAVIWGVLVAPLGTAIIAFLLNNVVVGGTSCGF